jgi:hypothetical protein
MQLKQYYNQITAMAGIEATFTPLELKDRIDE